MDPTQVRCGIKMVDCVKVADNLAVGIDDTEEWAGAPVARLFDPTQYKAPFRGYITTWRTPKRGKCFCATVFAKGPQVNRVYQTREGAIAGMVRIALRQMAPP